MPRGRPPIPRSKEEALNARREQVRKNVQAFRKRKQTHGSRENSSEAKDDPYTFVLEDLGQLDAEDRNDKSSSIPTDVGSDVGHRRGSEVPSADTSPVHQILQDTTQQIGICYRTSALNIPGPRSAPINCGPAALQQFSSNTTFAFTPNRSQTRSHWSQMLPSLVNRNRTLDLSVQALCMLQVGHLNCDKHIFPQSLVLYNRALKSLQVALSHHGDEFKIEIFAATMILGVYELLQDTSTEGRGWMAHFEGGATYLKMFPPYDVDEISPQMAFHFLEAICIFDALGSRRKHHCSESQWWSNAVDQVGGESYGALLKLVTSLPEMLEQCDRAMSLPQGPEAVNGLTGLLQLCLRMEDDFLSWLKRTMVGEEPHIQPLSDFIGSWPSVETGDPLSERLTFPDLSCARLCLLYWSSVILLYESIISILDKLHPQRPDLISNYLPVANANAIAINSATGPYVTTAHAYAVMILRTVPYCLEPRHGVIGKSLVLLPIHITRNHLWRCKDKNLMTRCDNEWRERLGQTKLKFGLRVSSDDIYDRLA